MYSERGWLWSLTELSALPLSAAEFLSAFQLSLFFFFFSTGLQLSVWVRSPRHFVSIRIRQRVSERTALANQLNAEVLLARFRLQDDLNTPCSTSLQLLGVRSVHIIRSSISGCIGAVTMYRSQNNPMLACTQLPFEAHLVKTTAIYPKAQFVPHSKMQIFLLTCGAIYPSRSVCELQSFGVISHRAFSTIKWS